MKSFVFEQPLLQKNVIESGRAFSAGSDMLFQGERIGRVKLVISKPVQ